MTFLLLSIASLACGPVFLWAVGGHRAAVAAADAFALLAIGGLVVLQVLPEGFVVAGWPAIIGAAIGFAIPAVSDWTIERRAGLGHQPNMPIEGASIIGIDAVEKLGPGLPLAIGALVLHALLDGTALRDTGSAGTVSQQLLALAVVLHRFPIGFTMWRWVRPHFGVRGALMAVGGVGVCTIGGALFGSVLEKHVSGVVFMMVQTAVAGSLLHVIVHEAPVKTALSARSERLASVLGALLGVLSLVLINIVMPHEHAQRVAEPLPPALGDMFLSLWIWAAPVILCAHGAVMAAQKVVAKKRFADLFAHVDRCAPVVLLVLFVASAAVALGAPNLTLEPAPLVPRIAAVVLGIFYGASIIRLGVRPFVARMVKLAIK